MKVPTDNSLGQSLTPAGNYETVVPTAVRLTEQPLPRQAEPKAAVKPVAAPATRRQIRGSSLLLAGRFLAKGSNLIAQLLIVRYLSQADYGAFAYALSIVALAEAVCTFGLDRAVTRFVPIYHEQKQYAQMFGTIVMVFGTILSLGLVMALLLYALQGWIADGLVNDHTALSLLLLLIFLAPVRAIDNFLLGMFAVFSNPKAIFFRKSILAPTLKLGVVLLLILGQYGLFFLAGGILFSSLLGVTIYSVILMRQLQRDGVWEQLAPHNIIVPWRAILAFTIPLLTSDLVYVAMHTVDVVMLEYFGTVNDVAAIRAVQPLAMMNQIVMASFATLFTPLAARMFARNDKAGINDMYWQTAIWIAVFTFPIFVVCFSIAQPVTVFLFGARYADSAVLLSLLGLGCYFHAALGFNGLTLKVYGKVRYIVCLNLAAAALNLALNLLLIPRHGALGAAIATCGTMVAHNILKQIGLQIGTGINFFERSYLRVYLIIVTSAGALWLVQQMLSPPIVISIVLACLACLLVFRLNRHLLQAHETFPELLKIPMARLLLGT